MSHIVIWRPPNGGKNSSSSLYWLSRSITVKTKTIWIYTKQNILQNKGKGRRWMKIQKTGLVWPGPPVTRNCMIYLKKGKKWKGKNTSYWVCTRHILSYIIPGSLRFLCILLKKSRLSVLKHYIKVFKKFHFYPQILRIYQNNVYRSLYKTRQIYYDLKRLSYD